MKNGGMKNKCVPALALVLGLCLAAGTVFADTDADVTGIFNDFLGRLAAKHAELESLAMPGLEVRAPPETEESIASTAVILRFKSAEDREAFIAALEAESIPYASFPNDEGSLLLFTIDMMVFVMQDAIGL
jgi:hypothetical protein